MKSFDKEEWSRIKSQGVAKYLLLYWVPVTIPAVLILTIIRLIIRRVDLGYLTLGYFTSNITFCLLGAIACGIINWIKYNRFYNA